MVNNAGRLPFSHSEIGRWRFVENSFPCGELEERGKAFQPYVVSGCRNTILGKELGDALPAVC